VGRRSGRSLVVPPALHKYGESGLAELTPLRKQRGANEPLSQDEKLLVLGEALFIARPVVYVTLATASPGARSSWAPWVVSLALDVAALACTRTATGALAKARFKDEAKHERDELGRRQLQLLHYLMLSPAYERGIGAATASFAESAKDTRGLGFVASAVNDTLGYYHDLHFYSSGS